LNSKNILQLKVMFSTINDSWEVVENIVEKWGFSPSVSNDNQGWLAFFVIKQSLMLAF
jgi:hypothetical protein